MHTYNAQQHFYIKFTFITPAYNRVAECLEFTEAILHSSGLPKFLWGEVVIHAVWLKNKMARHHMKCFTEFGRIKRMGHEGLGHDTSGMKLDGRLRIGHWIG